MSHRDVARLISAGGGKAVLEGFEFDLTQEPPCVTRLVDPTRSGQVWTFDMIALAQPE
jgi:hypothetical protein